MEKVTICPQCGHEAMASVTMSTDYLKVTCFNLVKVIKRKKETTEPCGYRGFLKFKVVELVKIGGAV